MAVILPAKGDTLQDYRSVQGETVNILARFYNMGIGPMNRVEVYLRDDTYGVMIDTVEVTLSGLSTDSCYKVNREDVIFEWETDTVSTGVHRLRVFTEIIPTEPDHDDNTARLVYVIDPPDYATEILDNLWDMTESTGINPPLWHTNDIASMTGWNISLFTDSISGMFEGGIDDPTELNRMFLNTGSDSSEWIDADDFVNFSLIGKASRNLTMELYWIDSDGDTSHIDPGISLTSSWQEIGPVDLSAITGSTWGGYLQKLWLEFGEGSLQSVDVRIGLIKLTE